MYPDPGFMVTAAGTDGCGPAAVTGFLIGKPRIFPERCQFGLVKPVKNVAHVGGLVVGQPLAQEKPSSPELIIITGKSEISGAEMALENGAWDYLEKPPACDDVKLTLKRALQFRDNKMVSPTRKGFKSDFIIGRSPVLKKYLDLVAKSARTLPPAGKA